MNAQLNVAAKDRLTFVCWKWKPMVGYRSKFSPDTVNTSDRTIRVALADHVDVLTVMLDPPLSAPRKTQVLVAHVVDV